MAEPKLLTVPQVAAEFQVTAQTIRNWIDQYAGINRHGERNERVRH